jgi:GAF domain-containing protein
MNDDEMPSGQPAFDDLAAEDAELRRSLAGLSMLVVGSGQVGLEDMLRHVAEFAVRAIPRADGAGLTLLEDDRADTIVASSDFVRAVDEIQYGLGEGPCITAARDGRTVHSGSLGTDPLWPRFGPRVSRLNVNSALSLPLRAGDRVLGAMNIYAHEPHVFDGRAIELGELFAIPASISVQNAQLLAQASRLSSRLQSALTGRATIDQALGILMSRTGCTVAEAFDKLRAMSQTENRKSTAVAQSLIDEAVRRARARLAGS